MKLWKPHWVTHGRISKNRHNLLPIYTIDIHPDGKRLATGGLTSDGGIIVLWDMNIIRNPELVKSSKSLKLFQMENHQACVNCVRWSPNGRWLASGGMDRVIMIWVKTASGARATTGFGTTEKMKFTEHWRCASVLRHHSGDIIDLAWALDGTRLASASVDNTVVVWGFVGNVSSGNNQLFQSIAVLRDHQAPVKGVSWDPAGRYIATQADDVGVRVWRVSDWREETRITKPFTKAADQSQVTRLSWSPDGSVIVAPHATNNKFPTAQLINRNLWLPGLDLVGHEKHVVCTRYNPNLLRKRTSSGSSTMICLALGSKDRSISIWTTLGRRAFLVIRDLFTSTVNDLTWSTDGKELIACSLDGSISCIKFSRKEIGEPLKTSEVARLHHKSYGQSLLDALTLNNVPSGPFPNVCDGSSNRGQGISTYTTVPGPNGAVSCSSVTPIVVLETPEAFALLRSQAELRVKLNASTAGQSIHVGSGAGPAAVSGCHLQNHIQKQSKQTEELTKDGRRRITPRFLGTLDSLDEESLVTQLPRSGFQSSTEVAKVSNDLVTGKVSLAQFECAISAPEANDTSGFWVSPRKNLEPEKISPKSPKTSSSAPPSSSTLSQANLDIAPDSPSGRKRKRSEPASPIGVTDTSDFSQITSEKPPKRKRRKQRILIEEDEEAIGSATMQAEEEIDAVVTKNRPSKLTLYDTSPGCLDQVSSFVGRSQFVCCNPIEGPFIVKFANVSDVGVINSNELHRVTATRGEKILWELTSCDRFTSYAHTDSLIAIGDARGRLRLILCNGSSMWPALITDSSLLLLAAHKQADSPSGSENRFNFNSSASLSSYLDPSVRVAEYGTATSSITFNHVDSSITTSSPVRLAAITASGRLLVWTISQLIRGFNFDVDCGPRLFAESSLAGIVQSKEGGACSSLEFSEQGFPVIRLLCGSCYLFNTDLRLWIELFDAMDPVKCHAAITMHRSCPSGSLSSLQQFFKIAPGRMSSALPSDSCLLTPLQRTSLNEFLNCQVQNAILYGSSSEFKFWLLRWFRQLVENGDEERIRHICVDFIGPFSSNTITGWSSHIKGISKRGLIKDLLALFALNLRMQRLYVEIKELFDHANCP